VLYHGYGFPLKGSGWLRSLECNIMEKGCGQFWSVYGGSTIDVEGERMDPSQERFKRFVEYGTDVTGKPTVIYKRGGAKFTVSSNNEGVIPDTDFERPYGEWNVVEVMAVGQTAVHLVNGKLAVIVTNSRRKDGDKEVPLTRGKIQLQSEGAEIFYRKVEIRPLAEIPKEHLAEATPVPVDDEGFRLLFGKDRADGWVQCGPGSFKVENGVATGAGGMGLWWYKEKMFANFILKGEFLQEQEFADSGVFVRFPDPGNDPGIAIRKGHEIEIGDNSKPSKHSTGSVYPFQGPTELPVKPPGEWNEYEIACLGKNYYVRLNGKLVTTYADAKDRPLSGYIGLQNYDDTDPLYHNKTVRHRNVRIKELPGSAEAYHVLFEGDLKDWKRCGPGSFELKDGALISRGGMGLFWHKKSCRDFILMLEWKTARREDNSGVFVRFPDPGNDPQMAVNKGYEIQIDDVAPEGKQQTGAICSFQAASTVPTKEPGQWNHAEITATGQHYTVRINGRRVNDFIGSRSLEGYVGIQNHDDGSKVGFRDIRLIELKK
jgi:hypothetical protein